MIAHVEERTYDNVAFFNLEHDSGNRSPYLEILLKNEDEDDVSERCKSQTQTCAQPCQLMKAPESEKDFNQSGRMSLEHEDSDNEEAEIMRVALENARLRFSNGRFHDEMEILARPLDEEADRTDQENYSGDCNREYRSSIELLKIAPIVNGDRQAHVKIHNTKSGSSLNTSDNGMATIAPKSKMRTVLPWTRFSYQPLIHRQGINMPPLVMQFEPKRSRNRPHYKLFLPQISCTQEETILYARRKSSQDKFRFSLDPDNLQKRGNKYYAGKAAQLSKTSSERCFLISTDRNVRVAEVWIDLTERHVRVEILNEVLNFHATGREGRQFKGLIRHAQDVILKLTVRGRTVFELQYASSLQDRASMEMSQEQNKLLLWFTEPLNFYSGFAIATVVHYTISSSGGRLL